MAEEKNITVTVATEEKTEAAEHRKPVPFEAEPPLCF